jgi:hypothetical protein
MDDNDCRQLDAYLDMQLSGDERCAFVEHMSTCAACREAVDEQRWIDELLRSDEATAIEAAPVLPVNTIRVGPRRRWLVAAAAAAVVVAATLATAIGTRKSDARRPVVASAQSSATAVPNAEALPAGDRDAAATFVSAGSSIAISVASDDPQVTIVQLYPTVTASRRWAREATLRANALPHNGG